MNNKAEVLYQTPGKIPFLTIKKVADRNFFFCERAGVDSVSIVLMKKTNKHQTDFGLIREAKPPFNERENHLMHFKESAIGGSFFDHPRADDYMYLQYEEQLKIAKEIAIKEVEEEAGYKVNPEKMVMVRRVAFNSMSNEYIWLFVAVVEDSDKCESNPQNEVEAMAEVVWHNRNTIEELMLKCECGKTLATMMAAAIDDNLQDLLY